jgi:hypothetical protein
VYAGHSPAPLVEDSQPTSHPWLQALVKIEQEVIKSKVNPSNSLQSSTNIALELSWNCSSYSDGSW